MKRKGRHPSNALSGTLKRWILRTVVQGKRRDIGLGGLSCTSLVEARVRAKMLRKIAREGGDPLAARDQVFRTRHPEVTQAVNDTLELLKKAGVVIDDVLLARLGVTE